LAMSHIELTMERAAALAGLILMLCAIDYLKGFRFGLMAVDNPTLNILLKRYRSDPQHKYLQKIQNRRNRLNKAPGKYYIAFLKKYLLPINPNYKIKEVYKNLRCGLLHNYSDHIFRYDFIDNRDARFGNRDIEHLTPSIRNRRKRVKFNIDTFYGHFKLMCERFWSEALTDTNIQMNIHDIKSYVGFMQVIPE